MAVVTGGLTKYGTIEACEFLTNPVYIETLAETAREISLERGKEHQCFNRFYSKVVHPTAYSLMAGKLESTNWNALRSTGDIAGCPESS